MKHKDKRQKMKALAISRFIVEQNMKLRGLPEPQRLHASIQVRNQAHSINRVPYHVFRHDKPELDKRRWKRYNRKQMKGVFLV